MQATPSLNTIPSCKITFIGGGNMAQALIQGLTQLAFEMSDITVVELDADKRRSLIDSLGVNASESLNVVTESDVVILAVKPQQLKSVTTALSKHLHQQLVISVAAGIRTDDICRWLGGYTTLIRTMPNTPAQIQAGITGMYALNSVSEVQKKLATVLMQSAGEVVWLNEESLLDAVTAISGSGPAYVFLLIEALTQAGVALGLSQSQAEQLSKATFKGASLLASQSTTPVQTLREQVTSKGGTTEQGLLSLQQDKIFEIITKAAQKAAERAVSLGNELGSQ